MKFKRLLFSISAALALLILPSSSFAGWGWRGGGGWHGGWHGGHWYRWGWWPGHGWGWWGWGGWYPYAAWGEYPYGYYGGAQGDPPGAQDETSAIQSRLANLGFYHGPVDGKVGPGTESALKAFQSQHGLRASGQIDDETLNALGLGEGQGQ